MASSDEESSQSDFEDDFDMEAIRRACQITGTSPSDLRSRPQPSGNVTLGSDSDSDGDDDEDELALVRSINQRFAGTSAEEPLTLKPLRTKLPDDTDNSEDDYEALRAIQKRFASTGGDLEGVNESQQRSMQVGATVIDSEKETSSSLFVERTNAPEGFLNCVDKSEYNGQILDENMAGSPLKQHLWPESAHVVYDAIKMNRGCSEVLHKLMGKLESKMADLKKVINDVKRPKKSMQTSSLSLKLVSLPQRRANAKIDEDNVHALYRGPPENPHVANYKEALAAFPVPVSRGVWSKEEKENLLKGLKQQIQRTLLQHSVDLLSDADVSSVVSNDVDDIISSIKDVDITPERIRSFLPRVNWELLASMYLTGRTGAECQTRFLNLEDPLINHNQWTSVEDKKLLHVVQQKGLHNWIDIATSLGTNRTPFQCLARYQRSLNASILKREWTKEEDDQLRAAVETSGESNWQVVASAVEGRTGTQCSNRWRKTLNPARERVGKWSLEEDKHLKVAVALFGPKSWKKVANYVPGRTQVQCRERWVNCLDPSMNTAKWTEEEDSKLEAAIAQHGFCWTKVAACIPHRTDNQCWRRWKALFPHEVPLFQEARKIQKTALITNFVDRESERPALGPKDFIVPDTFRIKGSKNVDKSTSKNTRSRGDKAGGKSCRGVKNRHGRPIWKKSSGKRITERRPKEHEDPDWAEEECPLPVALLGDYAIQSKKTSKRCSRRKSMKVPDTADEEEMNVGDELISKMKETKKDKKNRAVPTRNRASSFPDSLSLLDIKKKLKSVNRNKSNKKLKLEGTYSNDEDVTFSDCPQSTLEHSKIKMSDGDRRVSSAGDESPAASNQHCQAETVSAPSVDFEGSAMLSERHHSLSLQGNCLQHSVIASNSFKDHSLESNYMSKFSHAGEPSETEDDVTLASLLQESSFSAQKVAKLPAVQRMFKGQFRDPDVIITYSRRKRKARDDGGLKNSDDVCPSKVVEAESADESTLAHFCRKFKKRRTVEL